MELAELRGWLRGIKGALTYDAIARWANTNGRLPTHRVVLAFAQGAVHAHARGAGGAGALEVATAEQTGQALWEAADSAVRRRTATGRRRAARVPGRITTKAGLAKAMRRLQAEAGNPSLRALAAAPEAAGRVSRSALQLALAGRQLSSEQLLTGFAAACHASETTAQALLAARRRILNPRGPAVHPCEIAERAEEHRQQDEAARPWLAPGPEPDPYDQQLLNEDQAATHLMTAWTDNLTADELQDLQARAAAGDGRDLRAELTDVLARTRTRTRTRTDDTSR
ncbi:hypothetical protein [Streptomyces sp. NBC_01601]|uniref:hypothetical protein n=1 Tax=Streptomyces sp. NBC_01601 TaxID=2975892 RepID=UPI002E2A4D98|nr:hypothetical protein [Streptomyces sp. NBC_01601]